MDPRTVRRRCERRLQELDLPRSFPTSAQHAVTAAAATAQALGAADPARAGALAAAASAAAGDQVRAAHASMADAVAAAQRANAEVEAVKAVDALTARLDAVGAVSDALWSDAHDWLVHWYGADTSSAEAAEGAEVLTGSGHGLEAAAGAAQTGPDPTDLAYGLASLNTPVPQQYCGRPIVTESSGAKHQGWNQALRNPAPDTTDVVDHRQVYVTDHQGRVVHVEADLQHLDKPDADARRHEGDRTKAGGPDRLTGDEGGQLVASSLGGPGEALNLVPMPRSLNGPGTHNWWAMGRGLDAQLQADPDTDIRFDVDVTYPEDSKRPERYQVDYTVDGQSPQIRRFDQ